MFDIEEIARSIRASDGSDVRGIGAADVQRIRRSWGVDDLPRAYVDFLVQMGISAGKLLRGTNAFFPQILELPADVEEFLEDNEGGISPPAGAQIFAMHQGYQVYWMSSVDVPDPEVVLYMEGEPGPMRTWPSFTAFLNSEYQLSYGSGDDPAAPA